MTDRRRLRGDEPAGADQHGETARDKPSGRNSTARPERERPEPIVDVSVLDELRKLDRQGEPSLIETLSRVFRDQTASQLEDLDRILREGDAESLERTAHALKGSCASIGARRMARLASELHGLGRTKTLTAAPGLLASLREEFVRANRVLEQEASGPTQDS